MSVRYILYLDKIEEDDSCQYATYYSLIKQRITSYILVIKCYSEANPCALFKDVAFMIVWVTHMYAHAPQQQRNDITFLKLFEQITTNFLINMKNLDTFGAALGALFLGVFSPLDHLVIVEPVALVASLLIVVRERRLLGLP